MKHTRTTRALAAIAFAGVLVAGCGGDDEPTTEPTQAVEETSADEAEDTAADVAEETAEEPGDDADDTAADIAEETTEEPADDDTSGDSSAGAGDLTPPGTTLALGEQAIVPFNYAGTEATLGMTVTAIDQGENADLDELELGDQAAGFTPYYIRIEVEGLDDAAAELAYSSIGDFDGLLGDGSQAQPLYVMGSWDTCLSESLPRDFGAGVTHEVCVPVLASGDAEVTAAQYGPSDTDYASFDGEPVVWE